MNRPNFFGDTVWDALYVRWEDESFKKKSMQARLNCSSDSLGFGGSLYASGSIIVSQHRANLVNFLNYWHYLQAIFTNILLFKLFLHYF